MRHTVGPSYRFPDDDGSSLSTGHVQLDTGGGTPDFDTWGDWVALLPLTEFPTVLLGITGHTYGFGAVNAELQFGMTDPEVVTPTASDITEIGGPFAYKVNNLGNGGPARYDFGVPISGIPAYRKLWIRQRQDTGAALFVSLRYAYSFDSAYCLDYDQSPIGTIPLASLGTIVTPNATAWAYSDWATITEGLSVAIGLSAIIPTTIGFQNSSLLYDVEIGIGADGFEQVVWAHPSFKRYGVADREPPIDILTSLRLIPANTRIAVRIRKSGTNTAVWRFKLNYYGPVTQIEDESNPAPVTQTLVVRKETDTESDQEFQFTVTGPNDYEQTFALRGGEQVSLNVEAGAYSVFEAPVAGWNGSAEVDNGDDVTNITVGEGETRIATFTNSSQAGEGGPGEFPDFEGDCVDWTLLLINQALSLNGINKLLTAEDLLSDPPANKEAAVAQLHVRDDIDYVLRLFPWEFATKYEALDHVDGSGSAPVNGDWTFSYRKPSDCVFERRIVKARGLAHDPTPPPMRLSHDSNGGLILTNEADAELEFTSRTTCPAYFGDALFKECVILKLAQSFSASLTRLQNKQDEFAKRLEGILTKAYHDQRQGNPGLPADAASSDAFDQSTAAVLANLAVVNRALVRIGAPQIAAWTDQTREATAVRNIFEDELQTMLREYPWAFTTRYANALTQLSGDQDDFSNRANADWEWSYRLPDDCVRVRRLVKEDGTARAWDDDPRPFSVGSDSNGGVLFVKFEDPIIEFTKRIDECVRRSDAAFRDAFAWRLAAVLAPSLAVVDPGTWEQRGRGADATETPTRAPGARAQGRESRLRVADWAWSMYYRVMPKAEVADANERERQRPVDGGPDWITGR